MRIGLAAGLAALWLAGGTAHAARLEIPPAVIAMPAPAGSNPQAVKLARVVVNMTAGQEWGTVGYKQACDLGPLSLSWYPRDGETYVKRLNRVFDEELTSAGFKGSGSDSLFGDDTDAAVQVGAVISNVRARLCGEYRDLPGDRRAIAARGGMVFDVEWQLYDALEKKVVARTHMHAGGQTTEVTLDGDEQIFVATFRQSVRFLLNDPTFRTLALTSGTKVTPGVAAAPTAAGAMASAPIVLKATGPKSRSLADNVRSVATVIAPSGSGSGFLVSSDGYILTNEHVVRGSQRVKIRWSDGTDATGEIVRLNARRDVALIKVDPAGRPALVLRQDQPAVGDAVFAIGTPVQEALQNTVTKGIVSALRTYEGQAFIQSDVAVTHGNSGGPLIDDKGAVVGMTDLGIAPEGVQIGLNLFIPISEALKALALTQGS